MPVVVSGSGQSPGTNPIAATLPEMLAHSAERHADKAAFRFGSQDLTYEALVTQSNQLAQALRTNGAQPGDMVGVFMGKALKNAVAVYGIMAAGAAYVPLDPAAPVAALERVIDSCKIRHIVSEPERLTKLRKLARGLNGLCFLYGIDEVDLPEATATSWAEMATMPATAPADGNGSADQLDQAAYVIFTSGSTGTPKGIVHTHRSALAYASMAADLYGLTETDRLSNFPPLHFDQSTFDFFSGPMVGATTVIIGKQHQLVPASLSQLIADERLTIWYSVPLALVQLQLYGVLEERDCSSLRWVIYGGEPFPLKHLKALMERWPNARFSNCYGPAETNQCTYYHVPPVTDEMIAAKNGIPIGLACPSVDTLILDADDQPVPTGQVGELVVSSPTTMTGYWDRDDLNQKVFYYRDEPSGSRRYYRTGDVVQLNDDNLLEFCGRRDRQIKIRGFRVELDGVEAVISTHDDIEEVAVTISRIDDSDTSEEAEIVAYVLVRPGASIDLSGLQRHAASRLARYAIPTSVVLVNDFPRTTSGKVDYPALQRQGASA